ncbi:MAG: hypothetical protein AABY83_15615 [Pseudomonadota bacterium]
MSSPSHALGLYVEQKTFGHSQGAPFGAITNGWNAPISDGTLSQGFLWNEAGITYAGWSLGALHRYDARVRYTSDTLEFMKNIKTQQPLTVGRQYNILLDINHFEAHGVRASYSFGDNSIWRVTVGGAYLRLDYLVSGKLVGHVVPTSDKAYDFSFDVDYFYSKDSLFDRPVAAPSGAAYTTDFSLFWRINEPLVVRAEIIDLYAKLHWPAAPHTVATGNSATKNFDANGYQYFAPAINGRESTEAYDQPLTPRAKIDIEYHHPAFDLYQRTQYTAEQIYFALGTAHSWQAWGTLYGFYTLSVGGWTMGWRAKDFNLEIGVGHWNPWKAHYGEARLSWHLIAI